MSLLGTLVGGAPARADVGVSVGPRGGLQLRGDSDPFVGADLRLTFSLSPLTLNPTFDYHFDEDRTLYQVAVNALYVLPISALVKPYAGAGIGLTFFAYDETRMMAGDDQRDSHGSRVGLNLIGGVTFPTAWLSPFVQAMVSLGKIDLVTIGGGVLFDLGRRSMKLRAAMLLTFTFAGTSAQAQVVATPYFDSNVAGDVEIGRGGVGASLGYYWPRLGLELDLERHPHFFKDEDVAGLVPAQGIDLNTDATLAFANAVVPYRLEGRAGIWCPYLVAGLGVIRAEFERRALRAGAGQNATTKQDDLSFAIGGGVMHALTALVGLRVDLRYLHALVDETAGTGGYFTDYGFWRASVGFTIGFPR